MSNFGKDADTIVAERAAVLTSSRRYCAGVAANLRAGRLSSETATAMQEAVRTFASDVAIGLHRDGSDPAGVRAAMRAVVEASDE